MAATCTHLDTIRVDPPEDVPGCEECLATGGHWVHLRLCTQCGHVGCCDSSPGRHASRHAGDTQHPVIRSLEPGEEWFFCFPDELAFVAG